MRYSNFSLTTTATYGSLYKSTTTAFPDKTVSEAGWTLEASLNYLKNMNMSKPTVRQVTKIVEVQNISASDGQLRMSGADLTSKFDILMAGIATEEATDASTAKLADVRISAIYTDKTVLEIKVDMGKGESGQWQMGGGCDTGLTIAQGISAMEDSINATYMSLSTNCGSTNSSGSMNAPCEWYAGIGNILHLEITHPNYDVPEGCPGTTNPHVDSFPFMDGSDENCFFNTLSTVPGSDIVLYGNQAGKLTALTALMTFTVDYELNTLYIETHCYRYEIYNTGGFAPSQPRLLEIGLDRAFAGGATQDGALSIDLIKLAFSTYQY